LRVLFFGESNYKSALELYYEKTTNYGSFENTYETERGNAQEPLLKKYFAKYNINATVYPDCPTAINIDKPHIRVNIDGLAIADGKRYLIECKSTNYYSWLNWQDGDIPLGYQLQAQYGAAIWQCDGIIFLVDAAGTYQELYLEIDKDLQQEIFEGIDDFWYNYVEGDKVPTADAVSGDFQRKHAKDYTPAKIVTVPEADIEEMDRLIEEYNRASRLEKSAKKQKETAKNRLFQYIEKDEAEGLKTPNNTVTFKKTNANVFDVTRFAEENQKAYNNYLDMDVKAFKQDNPALYKAYCYKVPTDTRKISIKKGKK